MTNFSLNKLDEKIYPNKFVEGIFKIYDESMKTKKNVVKQNASPHNKLSVITNILLKKAKNNMIEYLDPLDDYVNDMLKIFDTDVPSFKTLWDFCYFINVMEKVFFYHNDPSKQWCIDMNPNDPSMERKIRYADDNVEIRIVLNPDVMGTPIMNLHIIRKYGRGLENKLSIVDSKFFSSNDSDMYLVKEIYRRLTEYMIYTILQISQHIITKNYNEVSNL